MSCKLTKETCIYTEHPDDHETIGVSSKTIKY